MSGKLWTAAACAALLFQGNAAIAADDGSGPDPALVAYASLEQSVTLADGRSIHMVCMGRGSPTVVMTAGLGDWAETWSKVQPTIAKTTRACAWDRPAFGFSSPSPRPQTVDNTTADLEAALKRGGIDGPYVLVGHSLGGYESLMFADRHPAEVVGMVLVDPSIPDQGAIASRTTPKFRASFDAYYSKYIATLRRCAADLRSGKLGLGKPDPDECLAQSPLYPPVVGQALSRFQTDPAVFDTMASLVENFDRDSQLVINPGRAYGAMPLIVLTATKVQPLPDPSPEVAKDLSLFMIAFNRGHDDIAALSTRGVNRPVSDAAHYIHHEKPEAVIEAIEAVIAEARTGGGRR